MSNKPVILVTRRLPQPALDRLGAHGVVELNEKDRPLDQSELLSMIRGKDAILCLLTDSIDESVIGVGNNLKVIANYAVGYDNIDVRAATKLGIPVTNTPGVLTETTADLAWALLMAVSRRIVTSDRFMRRGLFHGWEPMLLLGDDVYGKTLGIVGCGRIGQATAARAVGFGMSVLYTKRTRLPVSRERQLNARHVSFDELLADADYVSIHTPLSPSTRHLFNAAVFKKMKATAYLINTARGPVVDEAALVAALEQGEIAGAGLDVYEEEPDVHSGLLHLDNAIIVPHIGSATRECRTRMAMVAAENVIKALAGERPPNLVNPEVYTR